MTSIPDAGRARAAAMEYSGESGIVGVVRDEPADVRVTSLDGLRAIAILLVIAHNVGGVSGGFDGLALKLWTVLSNAGWVGVQLFFALSGFLITRILLDGKGEPGWLRNFYARRVLRIVPLYYAFLFVIFVVAPHVAVLQPLESDIAIGQGWYWSYLSNWAGPFGAQSAALPHVWSLAVEEQFYLLWPLVIAVASDRVLAKIAAGTVVIALLARISLYGIFPDDIAASAAYTWTIARADTIVLGGLVALAVRNVTLIAWLRARLRMAIVVVVAAVLAATAVQRGFPAMGLLADVIDQPLSGILSALLVLACVCGRMTPAEGGRAQATMQRWLSAPWLTTIGKYSYAIYVVHRPVHVLLNGYFSDVLLHGSGNGRFAWHLVYCALVFVISMLIALVTWTLIEQPFLSLKRYFPMPARKLA